MKSSFTNFLHESLILSYFISFDFLGSIDPQYSISLNKGDSNFDIDVTMLDFNLEYEFQINYTIKAGQEVYSSASKK